MSILKPIAIPATVVAVVAASLYLGLTAISLFATVPESSANTAPEGSLRELTLMVGILSGIGISIVMRTE